MKQFKQGLHSLSFLAIRVLVAWTPLRCCFQIILLLIHQPAHLIYWVTDNHYKINNIFQLSTIPVGNDFDVN
jgi:hypothetical protein